MEGEYEHYLQLVRAVVSGDSSAGGGRRQAEVELSRLHGAKDSCERLLSFLSLALQRDGDDNVLFFIGQGLHIFVWRYWNSQLGAEQQSFFTASIVEALTVHHERLPVFARSKLEQVLAGVCGLSCTIAPVLELVVEYGQPGFEAGFSAIRTTCEELLLDDPRILPVNRKALAAEIAEVAEPLSNVVCSVCSNYIEAGGNANTVSVNYSSGNLQVALQLMRVLVTKLPVGNHLSSDLLQNLFNVCEIDSNNNLMPPLVDSGASSSQIQEIVRGSNGNAILAVEILTEIMTKRYIPPSTPVNLLVELAGQAVSLLQRFRAQESLEAFDTSLPQLEFIRVFVDSHIERAINAGTSGASPEIFGLIESFLESFSALTQSSTEPEVLYKMILIWEGLLAFDTAKEVILTNDACLQSVSDCLCCFGSFLLRLMTENTQGYHIFRSALMQNNELLSELSDEIEDDLDLDPYVEARAKALLAHVLHHSPGESGEGKSGIDSNLKQEESGSVGYSLLVSVTRCVTTFAESEVFRGQLQGDAQGLLQQALDQLTGSGNSSIVALDCVYLLRLMPLCMGPNDLIPHLLPLVQHMTVQRSYSQGKAFVYLFQRTCQMLETLLREYLRQVIAGVDTVSQAMFVEYVTGCMPIVLETTNCMVSPPPSVVMGSAVVFLLNVTFLPEEILGQTSSPMAKECHAAIHHLLSEQLGAGMTELYERSNSSNLPIEVSILITCLVSQIYDEVMQSACQIWGEAIDQAMGNPPWPLSATNTVNRVNASIESLSRFRADAKMNAKQPLLNALSEGNISDRLSAGLASSLEHVNVSPNAGVVFTVSSSLVSLSQALLQNLGKKSFFGQASSVFVTCCNFVNAQMQNGGVDLLFQGAGLDFTHQVLRLTQCIATSSTSSISTLGEQTELTLQLLSTISGGLNDKAVCAELLEEVLKCGWTCVSCYWQSARAQRGPSLGGLADGIHSSGNENDEAGGTVQPLVVLLMQLFAACMDPDVPPHDALLSIEGPMMLHGNRQLFSLTWFRENCWSDAITACIRVFLLRIHCAHHDSIGELLQALCEGVLPAGTGVEANSSELVQFMCQQIVEVSTEADDGTGGEAATNILEDVLSQCVLDANILINHVLNPIAAQLSRGQKLG